MAASVTTGLVSCLLLLIPSCGISAVEPSQRGRASEGQSLSDLYLAAAAPTQIPIYRYVRGAELSQSNRITLAGHDRDGITFHLARLRAPGCEVAVYEGISPSGRHFATLNQAESATAAPPLIGYCCALPAPDGNVLVRLRNETNGESVIVPADEGASVAAIGYTETRTEVCAEPR